MNKLLARERRSKKAKARIKLSGRPRLVVTRSGLNISAQIVEPQSNGDVVLVQASTKEKGIKGTLTGKNKVTQALEIGKTLGQRAQAKGILQVAFDRDGYKYHGRVKALAEGAREAGLDF